MPGWCLAAGHPARKCNLCPSAEASLPRPARVARPTLMSPCPSLGGTLGSPVARECGENRGMLLLGDPPVHPPSRRPGSTAHLCKCMQICAMYAKLCNRTEPSRAERPAPQQRCRPRYKAAVARPPRPVRSCGSPGTGRSCGGIGIMVSAGPGLPHPSGLAGAPGAGYDPHSVRGGTLRGDQRCGQPAVLALPLPLFSLS